jgi:1-acyl-sn-glycerol-3-phosphate acyltransferase
MIENQRFRSSRFHHPTMPKYNYSLTERLTNGVIWGLLNTFIDVHADELQKIRANGPLLLFTNHINFLEGPIIYTQLQHIRPRALTGFAKIEFWDHPLTAFLFDTWDAIPLKRGEADLSAIKEAVARIKAGHVFAMAPEGTRSRSGRLQRAHPGIAMLGYMSEAPIVPIANFGHENYKAELKHLRRPHFQIRVGEPFRLKSGEKRINNAVRQQMADEMMYVLAGMLPEQYRGEYADLSQATTEYLSFENAD